MDVTVKKWFTFDIKFLIFSTWSHSGIYVMKKYRVSTTNVPIFIEIRSGDKIRSIIFERSYGLQTVKLPRWRKTRIGCDWQSQFISRKTNLDHNKCIKIQMKIYIYSIYWISRPYLPRINSCFTNILNQ